DAGQRCRVGIDAPAGGLADDGGRGRRLRRPSPGHAVLLLPDRRAGLRPLSHPLLAVVVQEAGTGGQTGNPRTNYGGAISMNRFARPWLVAAGALLSSSPCGAQPAPSELEVTARALVTALTKEDFAAATKDFDETMAKVMPSDKLGSMWKLVQMQVGA